MSVEQPLVFVVDDDASAREGIEDILQSVGLPVTSFGSAQEFLHGPRPDAPGCIVLDVRLPGISGLEFQKILTEAGIRLPVIFITGAVAARRRQCWHRSRPLAAPGIEACFGIAAALRAIDAART